MVVARIRSVMISSKIVVKNESGLHAKPVCNFVNLVKTFNSKIEIENNNLKKRVLASSLLNVLTLYALYKVQKSLYIAMEKMNKKLWTVF